MKTMKTMNNPNTDAASASQAGVLRALRALAGVSPHTVTTLRQVAARQAALFRILAPRDVQQIPDHLTQLIPSIYVDLSDTVPVPGISFWDGHYWRLHVRAHEPAKDQAFAVLHQLKHIIDHPLRRQQCTIDARVWEETADYFAEEVLG